MVRRILVLAVVAAVGGMWFSAGSAAPPDEKAKGFMRTKLVHSQKLLEAIALEDFDAVAKHSEQLKLLSLDAGWQVLQTDEYVRHSAEFRRAAGALTKAADQRDLNAAVKAYFQLTQNCVDCHKYVRRQGAP